MAGANSGEPQLIASDRGVLLSWIEHDGVKTTHRFAERTPTGGTEPRSAAAGNDWSVKPIDVPSVLRLTGGTLVAKCLQSSGSGMHANDIRLSYSKDDGRTWSPSSGPHPGGTQAKRLFASVFEMPGAWLGQIWLEGLAMPSGTGGNASSGHNHPEGQNHVTAAAKRTPTPRRPQRTKRKRRHERER
jgi:hypothetical protein